MDWISSVKATFAKKEAHGASSIKKKKKTKTNTPNNKQALHEF